MQRSATMHPAALEKVIAMPVGSVRVPLRLGLTEAVGGEVLPELLVRAETFFSFSTAAHAACCLPRKEPSHSQSL